MEFVEKYTTQKLIDKEKQEIILNPDLKPVEENKIIVSDDTYALGESMFLIYKSLRRLII